MNDDCDCPNDCGVLHWARGMAAAEQDGLFAISVQGGRWWSVGGSCRR